MSALPKSNTAQPAAWTLRDEIAMRVLPVLITTAPWTAKSPDGESIALKTPTELSVLAYRIAEEMLKAREVTFAT